MRFTRLLPHFIPTAGLAFAAVGLVPVVSSDSLARSALSLSCLAAGFALLFFDSLKYPARSRWRDYLPQERLSLRALGFGVGAAAVLLVSIGLSLTTLTSYYGQRLRHDRLLETGKIAHAKVLQRCGWKTHGCLTIDFDGVLGGVEKRVQKSIPVDLKHYRLLAEGDDVTVVYPTGQISAAVFTEFNFDRWKPQVPRAWSLLLFLILAGGWLPLKRTLLARRGFPID